MLRTPLLLAVLIVIAAIATACGGDAPAAIVNDREISAKALEHRVQMALEQYERFGLDVSDEEIVGTVREDTLREMIDEQLLLGYGAAQGITQESPRFQEEYQALVFRFETEAALQEAMEQAGVNEGELSDLIIQQIVLSEHVDAQLDAFGITDDEVQDLYDYYADLVDDMPPYDEVAELLREELRAEKWQDLAMEFIAELRAQADIEVLL